MNLFNSFSQFAINSINVLSHSVNPASSTERDAIPAPAEIQQIQNTIVKYIDQLSGQYDSSRLEMERKVNDPKLRNSFKRIIIICKREGELWCKHYAKVVDMAKEEEGRYTVTAGIDYLLSSHIITDWCTRGVTDHPRGLMSLILTVLAALLRSIKYPLLPHQAIYKPIAKIISVAARYDAINNIGADDLTLEEKEKFIGYRKRIDIALTSLLIVLWRKISENPPSLDFFTFSTFRKLRRLSQQIDSSGKYSMTDNAMFNSSNISTTFQTQMDVLNVLVQLIFKPTASEISAYAQEALMIALHMRDRRVDQFLIYYTSLMDEIVSRLCEKYEAAVEFIVQCIQHNLINFAYSPFQLFDTTPLSFESTLPGPVTTPSVVPTTNSYPLPNTSSHTDRNASSHGINESKPALTPLKVDPPLSTLPRSDSNSPTPTPTNFLKKLHPPSRNPVEDYIRAINLFVAVYSASQRTDALSDTDCASNLPMKTSSMNQSSKKFLDRMISSSTQKGSEYSGVNPLAVAKDQTKALISSMRNQLSIEFVNQFLHRCIRKYLWSASNQVQCIASIITMRILLRRLSMTQSDSITSNDIRIQSNSPTTISYELPVITTAFLCGNFDTLRFFPVENDKMSTSSKAVGKEDYIGLLISRSGALSKPLSVSSIFLSLEIMKMSNLEVAVDLIHRKYANEQPSAAQSRLPWGSGVEKDKGPRNSSSSSIDETVGQYCSSHSKGLEKSFQQMMQEIHDAKIGASKMKSPDVMVTQRSRSSNTLNDVGTTTTTTTATTPKSNPHLIESSPHTPSTATLTQSLSNLNMNFVNSLKIPNNLFKKSTLQASMSNHSTHGPVSSSASSSVSIAFSVGLSSKSSDNISQMTTASIADPSKVLKTTSRLLPTYQNHFHMYIDQAATGIMNRMTPQYIRELICGEVETDSSGNSPSSTSREMIAIQSSIHTLILSELVPSRVKESILTSRNTLNLDGLDGFDGSLMELLMKKLTSFFNLSVEDQLSFTGLLMECMKIFAIFVILMPSKKGSNLLNPNEKAETTSDEDVAFRLNPSEESQIGWKYYGIMMEIIQFVEGMWKEIQSHVIKIPDFVNKLQAMRILLFGIDAMETMNSNGYPPNGSNLSVTTPPSSGITNSFISPSVQRSQSIKLLERESPQSKRVLEATIWANEMNSELKSYLFAVKYLRNKFPRLIPSSFVTMQHSIRLLEVDKKTVYRSKKFSLEGYMTAMVRYDVDMNCILMYNSVLEYSSNEGSIPKESVDCVSDVEIIKACYQKRSMEPSLDLIMELPNASHQQVEYFFDVKEELEEELMELIISMGTLYQSTGKISEKPILMTSSMGSFPSFRKMLPSRMERSQSMVSHSVPYLWSDIEGKRSEFMTEYTTISREIDELFATMA